MSVSPSEDEDFEHSTLSGPVSHDGETIDLEIYRRAGSQARGGWRSCTSGVVARDGPWSSPRIMKPSEHFVRSLRSTVWRSSPAEARIRSTDRVVARLEGRGL